MADYLLQESGFRIALEDGTGFLLLESSTGVVGPWRVVAADAGVGALSFTDALVGRVTSGDALRGGGGASDAGAGRVTPGDASAGSVGVDDE